MSLHAGISNALTYDAIKHAETKVREHGPSVEYEALLARDADAAYRYATQIMCAPFPAGEKAIASKDYNAYRYAEEVLQGPFPLGEPTIWPSKYVYGYYRNFQNAWVHAQSVYPASYLTTIWAYMQVAGETPADEYSQAVREVFAQACTQHHLDAAHYERVFAGLDIRTDYVTIHRLFQDALAAQRVVVHHSTDLFAGSSG